MPISERGWANVERAGMITKLDSGEGDLMIRATRFAAASLVALLALFAPGLAFADEQPVSPCVATDEQCAAYAEDGTLEARSAFQENLGNDEPSAGLVQQAIAREQANNGIATNAVPGDDSGMALAGKAHVLALRVSFPDQTFAVGDTLEALQALIGPRSENEAAPKSAGPFPYENLHDYYQRASYGKLSITGEAFDYQAQYERAYYATNIGSLFSEALAYLDEQTDLGRFDANGDGRIDAVYLHFAGPDTGWGSVWWSNEQVFGAETATYANGAVRLWNGVALANPCDQAWAAQTIIHETGHVLGLPDFYDYLSQKDGATSRTGILTFDMMMQNQGDHNGFSKWMLGWLPESKVTRVFANEDGIDVKRDGQVVEHVDAAPDGNSSIEEALSAFTSDKLEETGGIIVVSNEDKGTGMFSSYYLLQYDQFASNQSVYYESGGQSTPIPSGFRLFRVQADIGEGGGLLHSNTAGTVHNQLIELVDPDMGVAHANGTLTVPTAIGATAYGCMLFAGDQMTPAGYPSTNFYENINVGFTGLTFAVTESGAEAGRVSISYSDADKPADPADFTLTPAFDSFSNVDTLTFNASSQPLLATALPSAVQLIVDGEPHALLDISVDGTTVSLPCLLDASSIGPTSTCEIVFPPGIFVLSQAGGETAYSPEIRLPLTPSASMTAVGRSGTYEGTAYQADTTTLSSVFTSPDGTQRFFQIADGVLKLHTIDSRDAGRVTSLDVSNAPLASSGGEQRLSVAALSDTMAFLVYYSATGAETGTGCWVDMERGTVTASHVIEQAYAIPFASSGTSVVVTSYYRGLPSPDGTRGGMLLTSLTPREDGTVETHHGWTAAQNAAAASPNALACAFSDENGTLIKEVRVAEAANLVEALAESTATPDDAAAAGEMCTTERVAAVLPLSSSRTVLDVQRADGDYYVLMGSDYLHSEPDAAQTNMVVRFDASGTERSRFVVTVSEGDPYGRLRVARYGTVALLRSTVSPKHSIALTNALFCTDDGQPLSTLTTASVGTGAWLADGSWLDVGTSIAGSFGPKGSPVEPGSEGGGEGGEAEGAKARYIITATLDQKPTDPGDNPEEPVNPQPLPQPNDQVSSNPKPLASTGDPVGAATLAACAVIALAGVALARMRRDFYL